MDILVNELRELEELGTMVVDAVNGDSLLFISWYRDGRLLTANRPFCELTGYSTAELDEMRWPRDLGTPRMNDCIVSAMNVLESSKQTYRSEGEIVRKDGSVVPVEVFVHRFGDAAAKEHLFFSFITDISERKHREEELQATRDQARLFLDLISHDINNMNQVGIGYTEMALDELGDRESLRQPLTMTLNALKNSAKLIDTIRKVQRSEGDRITGEVDVCKVLAEVKADYDKVPGRAIRISLTPVQGCFVMGNELVRDIFSNLVGNSVKHSNPNRPLEVDIRVSMEKGRGRDYYKISITDNGPGLCGVDVGDFFAGIRRGTAAAKGRGLGLFLVKTLVDSFHGRVWAEDRIPGECGKGARFIVMFPAAETMGKEAAAQAHV